MNDEIRIIPITTKKGLKTFIQFHYDLYRDHKFAIPFLRFDEMNTLDPKKNPAFEFCEAQYFLAVDSEARIVGRIAAIINHRANEEWNKKQVRFGWFDFVDNVAVSCALLRAVENWGKSRGMNECVGPLGFTDMDREGLLIEGFDRKSTMYINYNYPSNPQPIGFSGILLAKRQNSFYCTYFLHNRNVADTKSPYPIKRLEVIRWFNQKSMVFNQSLS